jgi:hypothetical protein
VTRVRAGRSNTSHLAMKEVNHMSTELSALERLPAENFDDEDDLRCMCTDGLCYPTSTSDSVQTN